MVTPLGSTCSVFLLLDQLGRGPWVTKTQLMNIFWGQVRVNLRVYAGDF